MDNFRTLFDGDEMEAKLSAIPTESYEHLDLGTI